MVLKTKESLQDKYKKEKSYSQRLIEKEKTKVKKNRYSFAPVDELTYLDDMNDVQV